LSYIIVLLYQVNSIMDVSRPLYHQLQTLTDTENSNVSVSATQSTQSNKVNRLSVVLPVHVSCVVGTVKQLLWCVCVYVFISVYGSH